MKENEIETRSIEKEQLRTVTRLFTKEDIDLSLVGAGRSLYQSLRNAKWRTKNREDYIAKNVKYMFKQTDRFALLEIIQGDKDFWRAWIKQHEVFERTGLDSDNASIHRMNPDGNYEFGNIGVLADGVHKQEHAEPIAIVDFSTLTIDTYDSKTKTASSEGISAYRVNTMLKRPHTAEDAVTGEELSSLVLAMPLTRLEPTNSEEERKAQLEAHGFTAKTKEEIRHELAERNKQFCEKHGIEYRPI